MPTLTATELELKVLAPVFMMDDADPADDKDEDEEDMDEEDMDEDDEDEEEGDEDKADDAV